ncbi:hypothetical protein EBU71_11605 [bacterium]|jgi:hypothetical protein|nr:hypothetical protein [Candidatus Elulimicrobium humile]
MNEQVIYLKALVNKQPKLANTDEFKIKVKSLAKDIYYEVKPKTSEEDCFEGREFILNNLESFLEYAVDYSLADKFNELLINPEK